MALEAGDERRAHSFYRHAAAGGRRAFDHGRAQATLNLLGFTAQHGGLVRHAHRFQVQVGIKARGVRAFESYEKPGLIAALKDVVADVVRVRQREHHEVMPTAIGAGL